MNHGNRRIGWRRLRPVLRTMLDRKRHEVRVFDAYSKLIQLFGSERAFKFSASYGYGTAEQNDEEQCTRLSTSLTDKYGAIAERYDLVDGD